MTTQKGQSRKTLSQESQIFTHFEEISAGGGGWVQEKVLLELRISF